MVALGFDDCDAHTKKRERERYRQTDRQKGRGNDWVKAGGESQVAC